MVSNNKILFGILILILVLVIYFGCKVIKAIGPAIGKKQNRLAYKRLLGLCIYWS